MSVILSYGGIVALMNEYKADQVRNIVLVGHSGSGKTSLAEALLFNTGAVTRLGKVDDSTSVSDFDPEEQRRKISINTSLIPCEWNGYKINLLDSPGYVDFVGEVKSAPPRRGLRDRRGRCGQRRRSRHRVGLAVRRRNETAPLYLDQQTRPRECGL